MELLQKGSDGWGEAGKLLAGRLRESGIEEHLRKTFDNTKYNNGLEKDQMQDGGVGRWCADYFDAYVQHVAPAILGPVMLVTSEGGLSVDGASKAADKQKEVLDGLRANKEQIVETWTSVLTRKDSKFEGMLSVLQGQNDNLSWEQMRTSFLGPPASGWEEADEQAGRLRMVRWFAATHSALFASTPMGQPLSECAQQ